MSARWTVALVVVLGAVLALLAKSCHVEPIPVPTDPHEAQIKILQARVAELSMQVGKRDTVFRLIQPTYKAQRDTLLINVHDTIQVLRYVAVADSTVQACTALANDCRAFRREATALIDSQRVQVDWWRGEYAKRGASAKRWRRLTWIAGGAGLVAGAWIRGR